MARSRAPAGVEGSPFRLLADAVSNPYLAIVGIFVAYLYYGILQEELYRPAADGTKFEYSSFLLFVTCICNIVVAMLGVAVTDGGAASFLRRCFFFRDSLTHKSLPEEEAMAKVRANREWMFRVAICGVTYVLAMLCSNMSLMYVSYPMQALGKSCKLVPVMLGTILIGKASYSVREYSAVAFVIAGILTYRMAKIYAKHGTINLFGGGGGDGSDEGQNMGLLLLFGSLCLDGMTTGNQSKLRKGCGNHKPKAHELMFWTNFWGLVTISISLYVTGEWKEALVYTTSHKQKMNQMLWFGVCSGLGQNFIFATVTGFGPLVTTMITTSRKFLTILASVIIFKNKLLPAQWGGVLLVFLGLSLDLWEKYDKNYSAKAKAARKKKEEEEEEDDLDDELDEEEDSADEEDEDEGAANATPEEPVGSQYFTWSKKGGPMTKRKKAKRG